LSEVNGNKDWTPLPVDTRLNKPLLFFDVLFSLAFLAIGVIFFFSASSDPEAHWFHYSFTTLWFGFVVFGFWRHFGRWYLASRFHFFEEGITIRRFGSVESRQWQSVVKAEVLGVKNRNVSVWHQLIMVFAPDEKIKIPLRPFVKGRSLCDAIVDRIPMDVERPKVSLKDEWV